MHKIVSTITLFSLLLSTNVSAYPGDLYIGLDLYGARNAFDFEANGIHDKPTIDSSGFTLKFGAILDAGLRLEGYLQGEAFDEAPFDYTNDQMAEIGLNLIKTFDGFSPVVSPFIKAGMGFGSMELDSYYYPDDDTVDAFNLRLGMGLLFYIAPQVELLGGLDFQWRQWSDVTYYYPSYTKLKTTDTSQRYYLGVNFHF